MDKDYNFFPPYADFRIPQEQDLDSNMYKEPIFNPISQYEQSFIYYKYLCMQMEYKIKCKEYERLCNDFNSRNKNSEKCSN